MGSIKLTMTGGIYIMDFEAIFLEPHHLAVKTTLDKVYNLF